MLSGVLLPQKKNSFCNKDIIYIRKSVMEIQNKIAFPTSN